MYPKNISAREAARRRHPLDVADVQALEGALTLTERERDKALAERDAYKAQLDAEVPAGLREDIASLNECMERVHNDNVRLKDALKYIADGNCSPAIDFAKYVLNGATCTEAHELSNERIIMIRKDIIAKAERERDEARARARRACQILIEEIGADGPADVDTAAERAAVMIRELKDELADLRSAREETEHAMHMRIRAGYDKTIADCWRAKVAEVERERDEARAEVERLREAGCDDAMADFTRARVYEAERDEARAEVERLRVEVGRRLPKSASSTSGTTMTDANRFTPDWVSPPGDTLADLLEERGWTQAELAQRTGFTRKHINDLLKGRAGITAETAERLELVFEAPASFWLEREAQYHRALAHRDPSTVRLCEVCETCEKYESKLAGEAAHIKSLEGLLVDACRERDEAQKAYMDLMAERNHIHAERDEARAEVERLRAALRASPPRW